jgi:hypothetical protein
MGTPEPSLEQDRYFPRRKKNETSTEGWFVVIFCFLDPAVTVFVPHPACGASGSFGGAPPPVREGTAFKTGWVWACHWK